MLKGAKLSGQYGKGAMLSEDRIKKMFIIPYIKGKEWKRTRTTLAPTFSSAKMKRMSDIMHGTVATLISIIDAKVYTFMHYAL